MNHKIALQFESVHSFVLMKTVWMSLAFAMFALVTRAGDRETVFRQFVDFHAVQFQEDSSVKTYQRAQAGDGTWPDIDYASQRRGKWPLRDHLERMQAMAAAYRCPSSEHFQSEEMKQAVLTALGHWLEEDYANPNWWYSRIGVPMILGTTIVLMGEEIPEDMMQKARPILVRSKMGMTGQNKVWCAGNNLMVGLLYNQPDLMDSAVAEIWSELRVSTKEGIQPDWSFHQHGPQQQFGNYGMSFAGDMIKWASILHGTEYGLSGEKLEILRNYMLQGASWVIWKGKMDFSGCGRQIDQGEQVKKGRITIGQLGAMKQIDPEFSEQFDAVLKRTGFNPFWRSEMGVQRRKDWYASVKMSSARVIGSETCNSENMQGLHQGDGVLLLYQNGSEYEDIVPVWDWKRLPGTTCDQGMTNLVPPKAGNGSGGSDFSGVIGDGETGLAAMIYKRNNLQARKAYFFLKNHMVCLGAGIKGSSKSAVYTSVQQSWLNGEVFRKYAWVHHDNVAYQFLSGTPSASSEKVNGNWNRSFPTRGDRPASGEVFSLWVDHGRSPRNAKYAYRIYPRTSLEQMKNFQSLEKSTVLSNTPDLQAVTSGRTIYAVFYKTGKLHVGHNWKISVNGPCLMQFIDGGIIISDPTCSQETLRISLNGKAIVVDLPQGEKLGRPVLIK